MNRGLFAQALHQLHVEATTGAVTLERVVTLLGVNGHTVIVLFLSLPFMQPVPLMGLSTPMGLLIVFVSLVQWRNKPPWVPKKYAHHVIPHKIILKTSEVAEKVWHKLENFIHPRYMFMCENPGFVALNCFLVCIQAILLALPLPIPFSNTIPALGIVLNALGQLEKDGLLILWSYLHFLLVVGFFGSIVWGASFLVL